MKEQNSRKYKEKKKKNQELEHKNDIERSKDQIEKAIPSYEKDVRDDLTLKLSSEEDVYGIEKHFATFHQFRNSSKSEYICEFCDDFEEFNSQTDLFHHIQNTHNLTKVVTLEEGKSRFLQLIVDFNSHEDIFNLLQWIKHNDMSTFNIWR